jgi:hypothetical protein
VNPLFVTVRRSPPAQDGRAVARIEARQGKAAKLKQSSQVMFKLINGAYPLTPSSPSLK